MSELPLHKGLILYDGVCALCNRTVQWLIAKDKDDYFRFAALQSSLGQYLLTEHALTSEGVVLVENGKVYHSAQAALRIAKRLGGKYRWLYLIGKCLPNRLLDFIYGLVANNRYRIMGKQQHCLLAQPEWQVKFLD